MPVRQRQHGGDQEEVRRNRRKHHTESVKECTSWKGPKHPRSVYEGRRMSCGAALGSQNRSGLKTTADNWSLPVALQASSPFQSHCLHLPSGKG